MKYRIKYITFIIACIFISCIKQDNKTAYFADYLKNNHKINISYKTHYFVILKGTHGCNYCFKALKKYLDSTNRINDISIIVSKTNINIERYKCLIEKYPDEIFFDKECKIDDLDIDLFSTGIIVTKNKKIVEIKDFKYNEDNTPENFIKQII